jgi:hypothetical protein
MDLNGYPLGAPRGLYLQPWGALGRAAPCLARGLPWGESNLVSINSASSIFSWFTALPCRHYISHVQTHNNTNSVSRLCATKLSPTLVFIDFLGNEDKIPKWSRKIICLIPDLSAQQVFRGRYLLAPWSELGLPHVQIESIIEAHKFGIQSFSIRGRLGLRICTERSCYHGLWEYLSGWVDLVGKPPSLRSFMCWCFGPRVI